MKSKRRIAALIALLLAAPVGVAALEDGVSGGFRETAGPAAGQAGFSEESTEPRRIVVGTATVGGLELARPSATFPKGSYNDGWELLPLEAQYVARLHEERRHLVARLDVFPLGADGDNAYEMLPAQLAYFDGTERQRVAGIQPRSTTVTRAPVEERSRPL